VYSINLSGGKNMIPEIKRYGENNIDDFVNQINSKDASLILLDFDSITPTLSNHVMSYEVNIINKDGNIHQLTLNVKKPNFDSMGIKPGDLTHLENWKKYSKFTDTIFDIEKRFKLNEQKGFFTRGKLRISPQGEIFSYLTSAMNVGTKFTHYPKEPDTIIKSLATKITNISYSNSSWRESRDARFYNKELFIDIKLDEDKHFVIKSSKENLNELVDSLSESGLDKELEIKDLEEDLALFSYAQQSLSAATDINQQLHSDYRTIYDFQKAFENSGAEELYVYHRPYGAGTITEDSRFTDFNDKFFPDCAGLIYERSFVDSSGIVHSFSTIDKGFSLNKGYENKEFSSVYNRDIKQRQGIVFQKDGKTTHLFVPDYPSHRDPSCGGSVRAEENALEQWINAVKSLPKEDTVINYAKVEDGGVILIANHGRTNYIMKSIYFFDKNNEEKTKEHIFDSLSGLQMTDNTRDYRTFNFIINNFG